MSNIKEQLKKLPAAPGVYKFLDKNKEILYIGKAASLKNRVGSYFRGVGEKSQKDLTARIKIPLPPFTKGEIPSGGLWSQQGGKRGLDSRFRGNDRKKGGNDSNVARDSRMQTMVSQIHKIETIETDSVLEALILEANLIKKHQPRFNVKLKDDKSFVNIVVTDEDFPVVQVVRPTDLFCHSCEGRNLEVVEGGKKGTGFRVKPGMTYGPFPSAKMAKDAVEILQKIFLFRTCLSRRSLQRSADLSRRSLQRSADKNLPNKKCLLYDIKQCSAPCTNNISPKEYQENIKNLVLFLQGKKASVIRNLEKEMAAEAKRENFERAAEIRNQIFALKHIKDIALIKRGEIPAFAGMTEREGEDRIPYRIEAYDISNIGGKMAVGSMVVFLDGKAASDEYRKFKIKSVQGANDAAMMKEVLSRRLRRKKWQYPDLIILDGGRPQYRAICDVMAEMKVMIPMIAIAKGPTRKKADLIFSPNAARIDVNLIKQLRDEAHRFAIRYHRKLRRQKLF